MTDPRVPALDLAAIRTRVEKLPSGDAWNDAPWTWEQFEDEIVVLDKSNDQVCVMDPAALDDGYPDFIAHARQDVPALLDRIEVLEGERDALRKDNDRLHREVAQLSYYKGRCEVFDKWGDLA
jgi:hypothetical protein